MSDHKVENHNIMDGSRRSSDNSYSMAKTEEQLFMPIRLNNINNRVATALIMLLVIIVLFFRLGQHREGYKKVVVKLFVSTSLGQDQRGLQGNNVCL